MTDRTRPASGPTDCCEERCCPCECLVAAADGGEAVDGALADLVVQRDRVIRRHLHGAQGPDGAPSPRHPPRSDRLRPLDEPCDER